MTDSQPRDDREKKHQKQHEKMEIIVIVTEEMP